MSIVEVLLMDKNNGHCKNYKQMFIDTITSVKMYSLVSGVNTKPIDHEINEKYFALNPTAMHLLAEQSL